VKDAVLRDAANKVRETSLGVSFFFNQQKECVMPKPMSKAHKTVSYDFIERKGSGVSKKYIKRIANKGDRKAAKLALIK
jgi:hypothetical protein